MGNIITFHAETPPKFGYKPVKRSKSKRDPEKHGQLNLFSAPPSQARIISMKPSGSPFEEALMLDEKSEGNAKEAYEKAINAGDSVADAYCNLGIIESKEGNTVKAIDCFTKSLKLEPRHFESHYNLANLYSDIGDYALAKVHYEFAAKIQSDYPNLYYNLALVLALDENIEDAIKTLTHYKELTPEEKNSKAEELLDSLKKTLTV